MTVKFKIRNMKRTAKAHWRGSVKEGKGELTTQSEILNKTNYSFKTRFTEQEAGTNPEELLAASHAGCFTMAVSFALTEQGMPPTSLTTEATLSMEGFAITGMHLSISGIVPGISAETFYAVVKAAEKDCLISKALSIPITSEAHLAFIEN
jgi:osmotically inducible protein OsmC